MTNLRRVLNEGQAAAEREGQCTLPQGVQRVQKRRLRRGLRKLTGLLTDVGACGSFVVAGLLLFIVGGCRTSIGVPTLASASFEHAIDGVPSAERAHVWVSYQITIDAIDSTPTSFAPPENCLYYRVTLPAGAHTFDLHLNYATAMHTVRTDAPQALAAELVPGESYRLVNLSAGTDSFQPWLQPGAPPSETIELN